MGAKQNTVKHHKFELTLCKSVCRRNNFFRFLKWVFCASSTLFLVQCNNLNIFLVIYYPRCFCHQRNWSCSEGFLKGRNKKGLEKEREMKESWVKGSELFAILKIKIRNSPTLQKDKQTDQQTLSLNKENPINLYVQQILIRRLVMRKLFLTKQLRPTFATLSLQ